MSMTLHASSASSRDVFKIYDSTRVIVSKHLSQLYSVFGFGQLLVGASDWKKLQMYLILPLWAKLGTN